MLPILLLDTLVWCGLFAPRRLTREQARVLEGAVRRAEPVALSTISLLEIAVLFGGCRLRLKVALDEFFRVLDTSPAFRSFR